MTSLTDKTVIQFGSIKDGGSCRYNRILADYISADPDACLGGAHQSRLTQTTGTADLAVITDIGVDDLFHIHDLHTVTYRTVRRFGFSDIELDELA